MVLVLIGKLIISLFKFVKYILILHNLFESGVQFQQFPHFFRLIHLVKAKSKKSGDVRQRKWWEMYLNIKESGSGFQKIKWFIIFIKIGDW